MIPKATTLVVLISILFLFHLAQAGEELVSGGAGGLGKSEAVGYDWPEYASPSALAVSLDGKRLFAACATGNKVVVVDIERKKVLECIDVPPSPRGLAISKDGTRLYVTCSAPTSFVCVINIAERKALSRIVVGHTAMAPVLSQEEKKLYVCNRFDNDVSVIDLANGAVSKRIAVEREPVTAALTPDGALLLVGNHVHAEDANQLHLRASVSVIDTRTDTVRTNIGLGLGASFVNGVAVSPDGRFAAVTHLRSLYWLTTTTVEMGRMNCNALTLIDMERLQPLGMLLLDQTARGLANPWDVRWSADGKTIMIAHAGAHEVSLVDAPVDKNPGNFFSMRFGAYEEGKAAMPTHPVRVKKRIEIPGEGPRAMALAGDQLFVANYFSDTVCRIELGDSEPRVESISLGTSPPSTIVRKGEMYFNDARLCSQGWQSCASCHDSDARTDALNWDLLNDGAGNPKNTRSLLWAHKTGPAMALGVRASAEEAVRAGIHNILFTDQSDDVPTAIDAYLKSLKPIPSPRLVNGKLSPAAMRGETLFRSTKTGCADCHCAPYFTDFAGYNVGTGVAYKSMWDNKSADKASDLFYTPTLVELWRTAPYLHDGSAKTVRDVLTAKNSKDQHGTTSGLTTAELDDLVEYLLSL